MPETTGEVDAQSLPVLLGWQFADESIVPKIHPNDEQTTEAVLDAFDADSVQEIVDTLLPREDAVNRLQLGIATKQDGEISFQTLEDRLTEVEGIDRDIAEGIVRESCLDIPTLCKEIRTDDFHFLYREASWWDDAPTGEGEMESRLKDAGIWEEPEDAVAGEVTA